MKIVFVHPHAKNPNVASVRLNTLIPAKGLKTHGFETDVVCDVREAERQSPDFIVCMNPDDAFTVTKSKLVVFVSDGPKLSRDIMLRAHKLVVDSPFLLTSLPPSVLHKTISVNDALEIDKTLTEAHKHPGRTLKLVWIGAGGNYFFAEPAIRHLMDFWPVSSITDANVPNQIPWAQDTYLDHISKFDVGIVPYPPDLRVDDDRGYTRFWYKDFSRVALLQAAGLPVICSPLPSILMYVCHGSTGLVANKLSEWRDCMEALQADPQMYSHLAEKGWDQGWSSSSPEAVTKQWLKAFT